MNGWTAIVLIAFFICVTAIIIMYLDYINEKEKRERR